MSNLIKIDNPVSDVINGPFFVNITKLDLVSPKKKVDEMILTIQEIYDKLENWIYLNDAKNIDPNITIDKIKELKRMIDIMHDKILK